MRILKKACMLGNYYQLYTIAFWSQLVCGEKSLYGQLSPFAIRAVLV